MGVALLLFCGIGCISGCARPPEAEANNLQAAAARDLPDVDLPETAQAAVSKLGTDSVLANIDVALEKASKFLISRQSPDGAWRSDVYAPFREGDALTPLVLTALVTLPSADHAQPNIGRGLEYLANMVGSDGSIKQPMFGVAYPVYTAAGALIALGDRNDPASVEARQAWLAYLRQRQLVEINGWQAEDPFYGGWGYDPELPRKPPEGVRPRPLTEPNLSATAYALIALQAAGVERSDVAITRAIGFVSGCQNLSPDAPTTQGPYDDGGFFFLQSDAVRNKAGVAGVDPSGRERFASYGSATADGLRALLAAGVSPLDPRVAAGWKWLIENFSAERHPGHYTDLKQAERDSLFFYYCESISELLASQTQTPSGVDRAGWAQKIAAAILNRQLPDGSWVNPEVEVREDDPLVATSFAVRALTLCRQVLLDHTSS